MEKLESPDIRFVAAPVGLPVQLSLALGESTAGSDDARDRCGPGSPTPAAEVGDTLDDVRVSPIEAQTRRAKTVCISLLGLLLFALHYLES